MIERRRNPGGGRVAVLASLRHSHRGVVGIVRLLIIRHVASRAIRRSSLESPADVTGRALQGGMHPGQSEARELQVIELHIEPRHHVVTFLAGGREPRADVARPGRLLEVLGVAGVALGRHGGEITQSAIFVAGVAVDRRMRPDQREAVVVVLNGLDGNVPASDGMALLAARAHLAAMDIGVAFGALRSHIGKHRLDMALRAHDALVHSAKGKLGLIVIEFGNAADRLPSERRMAIGAGQIQRAVRTACLRIHLRLPCNRHARGQQQQ